jgi:putative ABC transport system permease protein
VVVGVAAIVGLQLTADILERSLTTSVRSFLRGDVSAGKGEPQEGGGAFTASELAQVQALVDEGLIDGFTTRGTPSSFADYTKFKTSILGRSDKDATLSLFTPVFFERDVFPYYGVVQADGQGLWDMIQDDFDVVVTSTLANRHDINVSDQLKLSGIDQPFNVKGILPGSALGRSGDPLSGNVVFSQATIDRLFPDIADPVIHVYILAPNATDLELAVIDARLEAISPLITSTTPAEMEADNQEDADNLRVVILVFGLVALAIGGMGIANTMQVLVSRRLPEAGVLKAIGLKGHQVMLVFLSEALIIGVVGSVIGVVVGLGFSFAVIKVIEGIVFLDLSWRIGAGPVVAGLIVGVLVTLAFGLLPTAGAGRVRPMAAIRPNDKDLVKGSWLTSIVLLLLLALIMGVMVGVLIGTLMWGVIGTLGSFAGVGVLLLILVGVVYMLSRLPNFGKLTLHLSFLEWRRRKARAASLLLAMSIGVLGIGIILLLADTLISGLTVAFEEGVGGDVIVAVNDPNEVETAFATIRAAKGVSLFSPGTVYETELVAINGDKDDLETRIDAYDAIGGHNVEADDRQRYKDYFGTVAVRVVDNALPKFEFAPDDGRMLNKSDSQRNTVVLQSGQRSYAADLGLGVGDVLAFQVLDRSGDTVGEPVEFEIVGVSDIDQIAINLFGWITTANDPFAAAGLPVMVNMGIVQVGDENRDELVRTLNLELDSVLVLEVQVFTDLFADLLRQFRTFPLVLSGLALLAAVVIVANAVALSTMERRKEIGLLKSMGAKARWVVVQLVLENSLLGLVGGAIGLSLAVVGVITLTKLIGIDLVISPQIIVGVLALTVVLSSSVTLFSAVPAARERPLDILRGE